MTTRHNRLDEPFWQVAIPFRLRTAASGPAGWPQRFPHALRPIRGLLLDACNILYDDTEWRRWMLRLLLRLGLRTEYGPFFRVFDRDYLDPVYRGQQPFSEALDAFLIAAGLTPGQAEEVRRALESHRHQSDASHRPLRGVRETLVALHAAGVKLGVLCNCEHSGDTIRRRLADLFGASPWATVISSRDLGYTMPDPACYHAALNGLSLPAAEVAFVGHDARELRGARLQGLATVAFNSDRDARADFNLQSFEDLTELTGFSPGYSAVA